MSVRLGIVMDPIAQISFKKDSSLAMLLAAQARGWQLFYMEQQDLYQKENVARGRMRPLKVFYDPAHWFELEEEVDQPLSDLDVILMRKDPPFDNEFVYSTYLLEQAEREAVVVVGEQQNGCGNRVTGNARRKAIIEGRIRTGMTRSDVESALGRPDRVSQHNETLRYHYEADRKHGARTVTFDEDGCVMGKAKR